jgi:hypothetical protein
LLSIPSLGPFLAYQFTIDLNYSEMTDFSEMEFVVAGPGAIRGIKKCFSDIKKYSDSDLIRYVTERADSEFESRNLEFKNLWGRSLQLIDCQNIFCEVDKYSRIAHPEFNTGKLPVRIKQSYKLNSAGLSQWYPPKWGISNQANA